MIASPPKLGVALRGPKVQSSSYIPELPDLPRIGSRGSPLALAQAHEVRKRLLEVRWFGPEAIEIHVIRTTGDAIQDRPLAALGGKGLFTKEIEQALLEGRIDIAVHSTKDMPTVLPVGLTLAGCLPREDARDAFVSRKAKTLLDLPRGAVVGTASLRRQAMVKRLRPDLVVVPMRGNVETRLRKVDNDEIDAAVVALAGLKRLGLAEAASSVLDIDEFPPAVGQGAIGLETRAGDELTRMRVAAINDVKTLTAITAERVFLAVLDGSCRTPIAGHARIDDDTLHFRGLILKPDGSQAFETTRVGPVLDAIALAHDAGQELRGRAGPDFFGTR
jgi:hydroxymethylbilane synthase